MGAAVSCLSTLARLVGLLSRRCSEHGVERRWGSLLGRGSKLYVGSMVASAVDAGKLG